ncbi:MAG: hypothetical protein ACLT3Y_02940 [Ruminococcus callidus]
MAEYDAKYVLMTAEDSALKNYLHIPVDSYIMQAVGSDNSKLKHCLKLECVPKKDGTVGKYAKALQSPGASGTMRIYCFPKLYQKAVSESD